MQGSKALLKVGLNMENNLYKISNSHISKNALVSRNRAKSGGMAMTRSMILWLYLRMEL